MADSSDEDLRKAWTLGSICLAFERSPGPVRINLGSDAAPEWIERRIAVRATFTQHLIVRLDGDSERLSAVAAACRMRLQAKALDPSTPSCDSIALDLCTRAQALLADAGADSDDWMRRRLVALCQHDVDVVRARDSRLRRLAADSLLKGTLAILDAEASSPSQQLGESIAFPGPSYDPETGTFAIASAADGDRQHWRLHTPGRGADPGLIIGPPGLGKSSLVAIVVVEAMHSGRFVLALADPSGRGQLPGQFSKAAWKDATDVDGTAALLRATLAVVRERSEVDGYQDPTETQPGLLLVIEECHHVFAADARATIDAEKIAIYGGSVGVSLVVTAPSSALQNSGGSKVLRATLARENAVVLGGPDALGESLELRDAVRDSAAAPGMLLNTTITPEADSVAEQ